MELPLDWISLRHEALEDIEEKPRILQQLMLLIKQNELYTRIISGEAHTLLL
jgi:hypothetical protein